jgi:phage shock protein A
MNKRIDNLEQQLAEKTFKLNIYRRDMENQLQEATEAHIETKATYCDSLERLEKEVERLEKEVERQEKEVGRLEKEVERLETFKAMYEAA